MIIQGFWSSDRKCTLDESYNTSKFWQESEIESSYKNGNPCSTCIICTSEANLFWHKKNTMTTILELC